MVESFGLVETRSSRCRTMVAHSQQELLPPTEEVSPGIRLSLVILRRAMFLMGETPAKHSYDRSAPGRSVTVGCQAGWVARLEG